MTYHSLNLIWAGLNAAVAVLLWRNGNPGLAALSGIVAVLCLLGALP